MIGIFATNNEDQRESSAAGLPHNNVYVEYTENSDREYLLSRAIDIFREYFDLKKQSLNYFSRLKPNGIFIWNMIDKRTVCTLDSPEKGINNCHGYIIFDDIENKLYIRFHPINKYKEMYMDVYCLSTNKLLGIPHEQ